MPQVVVVRASIKVRLSVVCSGCGRQALSDAIAVESACLTPEALADRLNATRLGCHFPVGWSKYLRDGRDELDCPACKESVDNFAYRELSGALDYEPILG